MARYRKVEPRVWWDEVFRELSPSSPSGQVLWIYLLTCPFSTAIPGLFVASVAAMADDLGWTPEAFRGAFKEVFSKGWAKIDERSRVVWVVKAVMHNPPENPNVVRNWAKHLGELPDCGLKVEACAAISRVLEGLGKAFMIPFAVPFSKGMANQEQEQEQDQEQDQDQDHIDLALKERSAEPPAAAAIVGQPKTGTDKWAPQVDEVIAHYRTFHPQAKPGRKERAKILARLRDEKWSVDELKRAIDGIHTIPHNMGQNDQRRTYLALELIFRDSDHVHRYAGALDESNRRQPVVSARERNSLDACKNFLTRHGHRVDGAPPGQGQEG